MPAFTVTVPGYRGKDKNKYTRKFADGRLKDAEAYMRALIEQGLTPDITPGETTFQVKDVRVAHEGKSKTLHSLKEAEAFVKRIESGAEVRGRADLCNLSQSFGKSEILSDTASRALLFLIYRNSS